MFKLYKIREYRFYPKFLEERLSMMQWIIDEPDQHTLPDASLADLCFDINSKLTAILVSTHYLEAIKNLPHPIPKLLEIIHSDAQAIYGMISRLNFVSQKAPIL